MATFPCRILQSGARMPKIGLGTYQSHKEQLAAAVDCALTVGYRHIDTASSYENEDVIGEVINHHFRNGKLKRKDLFLTTKLSSYSMHSEAAVKNDMERSLDLLKLSFVDMYLVHKPWGSEVLPTGERKVRLGTNLEMIWKMMENFYKEGKAKAIGLSNFSIPLMDKVWDLATIKPVNLQLEGHVYLQQKSLRSYCSSRGMTVTAYSPLGAPTRPECYVLGQPVLMEDPTVLRIANELKKTPTQVLLKYLIDLAMVPLPKSTTVARIEENLAALDVQLSAYHTKSLQALDRGIKYFTFDYASEHPLYVKGEEF